MRVLVDTSAFIAVLDADDGNHQEAKAQWEEFIRSDALLVCHNYILVETLALLQNRFGHKAVRSFNDDILPVIKVEWVTETIHKAAASALIIASRKRLSFVDCVSFEIMREIGTKDAFCFDSHFAEQGFQCLP